MTAYRAPLRDMRFVLRELVPDRGLDPALEDAVLDQAARFAQEVLAPLNVPGDAQGCTIQDGAVHTPDGFRDAFARFAQDGWTGLGCDPAYGGQGLPFTLAAAVDEMWDAANLSFSLCPLLTRGAIEAIALCGSEAQKRRYLPRLVSGEWTGTMNLTEPQAGSDLSAVRARAVPDGDRYRLFGTKIYITWGEHDLTPNILHLVLARIQGAPEGVRGLSLFVVSKRVLDADGRPGAPNDLRCVSLEHKLGIRATPTAMLAFGDGPGAIADLVGQAGRGLEYMFVMMNLARFGVGLEGVGIAERAYQQALAYARDRVQGTEAGVRGGPRVPIIRHPDVRRMLMEMKARTEAGRALAYVVAGAMDAGEQAFAELMVPVVKGWCTESAVGIASLGVQVHGGLGYIEATGVAQHLRDARITPIYEGTTGIQANDLVGRKLARDGGAAARAAIAAMDGTAAELGRSEGQDLPAIGARLQAGVAALAEAVGFATARHAADPAAAAAVAVPLLQLFGTVAGGWQMGRAALAAHARLVRNEPAEAGFLAAKLGTARFYADHILPHAGALCHAVLHGARGVEEAWFAL